MFYFNLSLIYLYLFKLIISILCNNVIFMSIFPTISKIGLSRIVGSSNPLPMAMKWVYRQEEQKVCLQ